MNFTKDDYETILYSLEGYIQGNDDDKLCDELVDICYRIESLYDEELYDELVDNVTDEDAEKPLTTQEQIDYINSNLKEVN